MNLILLESPAVIPFIIYFSIFALVLVLIFVMGNILISYFFSQVNRQKTFFKLFVSILAGYIFCTAFYAIIKTQFSSIFLIGILLFILLIIELYVLKKKPFNFSISKIKIIIPDFKSIFGLLAFVVGIYSFESFFVLQNNAFPFVTPFYDIIIYCDLIEGLNRFGQENRFNNYIIFDEIYKGTSLYHFTDLWFSAFVSHLFEIPALLAQLLVTQPLLIIIYLTGIMALFEAFSEVRFYHYFLAILMLFCGGLYLSSFDSWPFLNVNFIGDSFPLSFLSRKLLIVYIILIAFVNLIILKQYRIAVIILMCLIPLYPTTLIGIFGGLAILIIIVFLFKRKLKAEFNFNINNYTHYKCFSF